MSRLFVFISALALSSVAMYSRIAHMTCDFPSGWLACSVPDGLLGKIAAGALLSALFAFGMRTAVSEIPAMRGTGNAWAAAAIVFIAILIAPFGSGDMNYYYGAGVAGNAGKNVFFDAWSRPDLGTAHSSLTSGFSYGPIMAVFFSSVVRIARGDHLLFAAYWKFFMLAAYAAFLLAFSLVVRREHDLLLLAFQPLILFEWLGNGHFDALWLSFLCLALHDAEHDRFVRSALWLAIGTWIKFLPILAAPWICLMWLDRARTKKLSALCAEPIAAAAAFALVTYAAWLPYWRGFSTLRPIVIQSKWAVMSVFSSAYYSLRPVFEYGFGGGYHWWLTRFVQGAILCLIAYFMHPLVPAFFRLRAKGPVPKEFFRFGVALTFFLFVMLWQKSFWPWYGAWLTAPLVMGFGSRERETVLWLLAAPFIFYPAWFIASLSGVSDATPELWFSLLMTCAVWAYPAWRLVRLRRERYSSFICPEEK